jgi:hypothetical protein
MPALPLSDVELRETLERAREIATKSSEWVAPDPSGEAFLNAAEEIGIPREALLQALRERQSALGLSFTVGQTIFAPSVDGFWYPAEVTSVGQHTAEVQFVHGGSHTCALADLRPLALIPGRKLQADWPQWGWCTVTVESYDPETGQLTATDGWSKKRLPIRKIRLPEKIASPPSQEERRLAALSRAALIRCGLLAGGIGLAAGVLLDRLLPLLLPFLR